MKPDVSQTIDHLFRHEYGRIVAGLTSRFGSAHIELIEDSVQESLLKAMKLWAFEEMPKNPTAWLFMVARNKMIDFLRRANKSESLSIEIEQSSTAEEPSTEMEIADEQLKMIFACCNPALSERESLLLSLKLIGGFSVAEISRALLIKEEAAKKSIQRAKTKFRDEIKVLYFPQGKGISIYVDRVLTVIYLIFNEGYKSSRGNELIRQDLCGEALRLALILSRNKYCSNDKVESLIALICFKISRFDARIQNEELITLEHQDRKLWINEYIQWGFYYYSQATTQREVSTCYLEASIEFQYHVAEHYFQIDWEKVLSFYSLLLKEKQSPLIQLNYLIVHSKVFGTVSTLKHLDSLHDELKNHYLYYAFKADLVITNGDSNLGILLLKKALSLTENSVERKHLEKKIKSV